MTRATSWSRAGLLTLLIAAAPSGSDGDPGAYRLRIAVMPGAGSVVQRLRIPAAALVAARTRDLADLRIFDADGRAMPIARAEAAGAALRSDTLTALPILGAVDDLNVRRVSLRLDLEGRARVARVEGDVAPGSPRATVLGALFDARALDGTARSIALDMDVPAAQPVTIRVEASRDLATWRPLGDRIVYRRPGAGRTDATVALGDAPIAGDYLKLSWSTSSRPLSPVVVRSAALVTRPGGATALAHVAATVPPQEGPHALVFAVPFGTPIATVRITPRGDDVLVPVRILGRDNREQPWMRIGAGTAARSATSGIRLDGGPFRMLKIEADARTPGFTTPPMIRLGFAARDLLFLHAGSAPYQLAVGKPDARDAYLPAADLAAEAGGKPAATARAGTSTPRVTLPAVDEAAVGARAAVLWAVLAFATALLALFAVILWRRNKAADEVPAGEPAGG